MIINNENAIIVLCSHLCVGNDVKPLEPSEWTIIANKLYINGKEPKDIFEFTTEEFINILNFDNNEITRVKRLIERSASLFFEVEELNRKGIKITTRASSNYPKKIKRQLEKNAPPLFYYIGDLNLLEGKFIGFVGSRNISDEDIKFTENLVEQLVSENYSIVSGGAKGVDSCATMKALDLGGSAVEFLSDSMLSKIKKKEIITAIKNKKLLLLSSTKPDAGFNVGIAMQRNKYIYSQSNATIIIKSDYQKGGTWTGALENLRNKWSLSFCWNNNYPGNVGLINKGIPPINDFNDLINKLNTNNNITAIQESLF